MTSPHPKHQRSRLRDAGVSPRLKLPGIVIENNPDPSGNRILVHCCQSGIPSGPVAAQTARENGAAHSGGGRGSQFLQNLSAVFVPI